MTTAHLPAPVKRSPKAIPPQQGTPTDLPVPVELLRRFTVAEYHQMIAAGMFAEDENYELLEGWVVHKMGKNPSHWIACGLVRDALQALGLSGYFIHSQDPVTTTDSEPEPDVALVRGKRRDYRGGNPDPKKVPFVIEVADSSLRGDRGIKKRIYARAKIPVYWIVNVADRQVEIYTQPNGPTAKPDYKKCEIVSEDGELPVIVSGREVGRIAVKDILP